MSRSIVVLLCSALTGCDAPAPASRADAPVEPTLPAATPPAVTPPEPATPAEPATPEVTPLAGVGPGGAEGRDARRQAALALLTDGSRAAALELAATDPGRGFEPFLVDELTPKIRITSRGVPTVSQGPHTVNGPLDKDIVRRIVRAHINEVRYCYNQGLADNPTLAGRVTVDFEVLETGGVGESALRKTTVPDKEVGDCVVAAVKRWRFPAPERLVKVSYPFILAPAR